MLFIELAWLAVQLVVSFVGSWHVGKSPISFANSDFVTQPSTATISLLCLCPVPVPPSIILKIVSHCCPSALTHCAVFGVIVFSMLLRLLFLLFPPSFELIYLTTPSLTIRIVYYYCCCCCFFFVSFAVHFDSLRCFRTFIIIIHVIIKLWHHIRFVFRLVHSHMVSFRCTQCYVYVCAELCWAHSNIFKRQAFVAAFTKAASEFRARQSDHTRNERNMNNKNNTQTTFKMTTNSNTHTYTVRHAYTAIHTDSILVSSLCGKYIRMRVFFKKLPEDDKKCVLVSEKT